MMTYAKVHNQENNIISDVWEVTRARKEDIARATEEDNRQLKPWYDAVEQIGDNKRNSREAQSVKDFVVSCAYAMDYLKNCPEAESELAESTVITDAVASSKASYNTSNNAAESNATIDYDSADYDFISEYFLPKVPFTEDELAKHRKHLRTWQTKKGKAKNKKNNMKNDESDKSYDSDDMCELDNWEKDMLKSRKKRAKKEIKKHESDDDYTDRNLFGKEQRLKKKLKKQEADDDFADQNFDRKTIKYYAYLSKCKQEISENMKKIRQFKDRKFNKEESDSDDSN
jgi:hypothetical protein